MRKLSISIILLIATLFLFVPTRGVKAILLRGTYVVHYNCVIGGPTPPEDPIGEWEVDCHNNMTGWGWEPGHNCTYTEFIPGDPCHGWPQP